VLVVAYKGKKLDRRTKMPKVIEKHGVMVTTKKMYDDKLPDWTVAHLTSKGYTINQRAVMLLVEHIGNDLARIVNELEKLTVNLHGRTAINEDDIEQFIGISKEYNVFELQRAIARKDLSKAVSILNYFDSNPKAGPIQQVLPVLYMFFSKVWMLFGVDPGDGKGAAAQLGVNPYFMKDYQDAASRYGQPGVSRILLLLHHYNLKGIGMGTGGASDGDLMREMVVKMMQG
jgi:DNA polymerase-3 subunit delta